jgi:hypothetical protein
LLSFEQVQHGVVVQKLPSSHYFIVRAKLPFSRQRFDIRFSASTPESPRDFKRHPLQYQITTSKDSQNLLTSLDDRRLQKFGYAPIDPAGQLYGIVVLAPSTRRIVPGSCYFLIYIDRSVALSRAIAEAEDVLDSTQEDWQAKAMFNELHGGYRRSSMLFEKRLQMKADLCEGVLGKAASTFTDASKSRIDEAPPSPLSQSPATSPATGSRHRKSSIGSSSVGFESKPSVTVAQLQQNLRAVLESHTKDTAEEVHFDVALRSGEVVHRLRERSDFPGYFEGFYSLVEADIGQTVELFMRFPLAHASDYVPRKLGSWFVCRNESFPDNF